MSRRMQLDLLEVAEIIADVSEKQYFNYAICRAMKYLGKSEGAWMSTEEAKLLNPNASKYEEKIMNAAQYWWGAATMIREGRMKGSTTILSFEPEAINARLIGIAMMLTMPEEIINHKCVKKPKKKKNG